MRALVLGAGGSARAAVWALREAGAGDVAVSNRTPARAAALAANLDARAVERPAAADVLVNCTAVGLAPADDELAQLGLTPVALGDYAVVVDLVYRDGAPTELIAAARAAGARTVDGLHVLVAQGALSLELWTGREAPRATMLQRRARHRLNARLYPTFVQSASTRRDLCSRYVDGACHGHRFRRPADGGRLATRLGPSPERRRAPDRRACAAA